MKLTVESNGGVLSSVRNDSTPAKRLFAGLREWSGEGILFALGVSTAPLSIAASECALAGSLVFRIVALLRSRRLPRFPRIFWLWSVFAILEIAVWLHSSPLRLGVGEIRHLGLILAMFVLIPTLGTPSHGIVVWRAVIASGTVSSAVLITHFVWRSFTYRGQSDPIIYFRDGGFVHHWMVYGTIEILVVAGMLQLLQFYPEERWWLVPALAVNALAIVLSLTRMIWICALLVLAIHLIWRPSRWIWGVPLLPFAALLLAPPIVRQRVFDSIHPNYYSNSERVQMLRVGWRMIRAHPIAGVGPGRVDGLYTAYLGPSDAVPAYHGHLHNNLIQLAAEFGLPAAAAAMVFVATLFGELWKKWKHAQNRRRKFLSSAALLGLVGFSASGVFDYTYGHSLGLISLYFVVLEPLAPSE